MTVRTAMWMGVAALMLGAAALGGGCGAPFVPSNAGGSGGSASSSTSGGGMSVSASDASSTSASTSATSSTSTGTGTCIWGMANQCGQGMYCATMNCGTGTCQPVPPLNTQMQGLDAVCGCNGQTYWNASVAATHGMPLAHNAPCPTQIPCSDMLSCQGPDAHCNRDASTSDCGVAPTGFCVVIPNQCPSGNGAALCTDQSNCMSPCEAVKSDKPWKAANCN